MVIKKKSLHTFQKVHEEPLTLSYLFVFLEHCFVTFKNSLSNKCLAAMDLSFTSVPLNQYSLCRSAVCVVCGERHQMGKYFPTNSFHVSTDKTVMMDVKILGQSVNISLSHKGKMEGQMR